MGLAFLNSIFTSVLKKGEDIAWRRAGKMVGKLAEAEDDDEDDDA